MSTRDGQKPTPPLSPPTTSGSGGDSGGAVGQVVGLASRGNFPEGLRVVVVDDDPLCLRVVERMLIRCSYKGTHCEIHCVLMLDIGFVAMRKL